MTALQDLQKCYNSSKPIFRNVVISIDSLHNDSSLNFLGILSRIGLEGNEAAYRLAKVAAIHNADIDYDLFKFHQKTDSKKHGTQGVSSYY